MLARVKNVQSRGFPGISPCRGDGHRLLLSLRYRERHAYRFTVENSVYIDPAYQRQGAEKPYSIMP